MKTLKKITAAVTAVSIASALAGCTPSIGSGTKNALTVGGYDIPAGLFIYYTMQGYSEAAGVLQNNNGAAPELKDVRNAKIDEIDSTDWIQNKATEYCIDYAGIQNEFDAIGGELSQEDKDTAAEMADYYFNQDSRLDKNGVSIETMQKMAESTFKEREIFKYYYGFDGDKGCSEDELKDYFVDNFARVKYVSISLKNEAGEKVAPDKERELRNMAEKYAKQINGKSDVLDKMHEMDAVSEEYDEYVAAHTTTAEGAEAVTTTTTTTTAASDETTTTTTTDPYANERLVQKQTTTSAEQAAETDTETEPAEETDDAKNERLFNDFVFNDLPLGEAQVYEYSEDTIYIVLRGDLRERMTEDDYWSEDNIESLQSMRYYEEFTDFLDEKSKALTVEKNKSAYRRYSPFKLELESQTQ